MTDTLAGLRTLRVALVATIVISVVGPLLFVYQSQQARRENCDRVHDAFVAYTVQLGKALNASNERVYEFLLELDPILSECS